MDRLYNRVVRLLLPFFALCFTTVSFAEGWSVHGINLQNTLEGPYGSLNGCLEVQELKGKVGIDSVSTRKNLIMSEWDTPDLRDDGKVTEDQVARQFAQDKALGLKSAFTMALRLESDMKAGAAPNDPSVYKWRPWHGVIGFGTPDAYDHWFAAYQDKLLTYAKLAKKSGNVAVFAIGHEMTSIDKSLPLTSKTDITDYMNNLIYSIRRTSDGTSAWAKAEVGHLLSFSDAMAQRGQAAGQGTVESAHWPIVEKIEKMFGSSDRQDIEKWAADGGRSALSRGGQKLLIRLENSRRAYLLGMWEQTIGKVKEQFSSMPADQRPKVTYDMNTGDGKSFYGSQVGFLKDLDAVSMGAYFPLGEKNLRSGRPIVDDKISVEDFKVKWQKALTNVSQFMSQNMPGKKVIFDELGYYDTRFSTVQPWSWDENQQLEKTNGDKFTSRAKERPVFSQERENAVEALRQLVQEGKEPWIDGAFLWNAYPKSNKKLGANYDGFCVDCGEGAPSYESELHKLFESTSEAMGPLSDASGVCQKLYPNNGRSARVPYAAIQDRKTHFDQGTSSSDQATASKGPSAEPAQ